MKNEGEINTELRTFCFSIRNSKFQPKSASPNVKSSMVVILMLE